MLQRVEPVAVVRQQSTDAMMLHVVTLSAIEGRRIALEQGPAALLATAFFVGIYGEIANASRNTPLLHRGILASHIIKVFF